MPNFNWEGNAEAIYDKSISATPFLFRSFTRDGLNKLLKEHTPKPFLHRGMHGIAPLLTDPTLADL